MPLLVPALCACLLAQDSPTDALPFAEPEPVRLELAAPRIVVPADTSTGHVRVDVGIDGRGPFSFAVDTAASGHGRIDPDLAHQLGLEVVGEVLAADGTLRNSRTVPLVRVGELQIGGLTVRDAVLAASGSPMPGPRSERGVLGIGLFEDLLLTVDYPASRLVVERGELEPGPHVLPMLEDRRIPRVEIAVGSETLVARIDTGNMGGFTVAPDVLAKLPTKGPERVVGFGRSANNEFEIRAVALAEPLRVAGHEVTDVEVSFIDIFRGANLGYSVLSPFALTFDQANGLVRFERASSAPAAAKPLRPRLGAMLSPDPRGVRVVRALPGTPAERAGLADGDLLLEVAGRPASELFASGELGLVLASSDTLVFAVERGGQRVDLTVRMAESDGPSPGRDAETSRPADGTGPEDPARRLDALLGTWKIEASAFAGGGEPRRFTGTATFERDYGGRYVHERFQLDADGHVLTGDAWIGWFAATGRYELTQLDGFNPHTLWCRGAWDPERERIALEAVDGARELRWEYELLDGGGFVKEMWTRDPRGEWVVASDYRYTR